MRATGDRSWEAPILCCLGVAQGRQGRFEQAIACLEQSQVLARSSGDRQGQAHVLQSLGGVHHRQGRFQDAVGCLEQSVVLARATGDRAVEAYALCTSAMSTASRPP
jgi:uncharacterized protein HemY